MVLNPRTIYIKWLGQFSGYPSFCIQFSVETEDLIYIYNIVAVSLPKNT